MLYFRINQVSLNRFHGEDDIIDIIEPIMQQTRKNIEAHRMLGILIRKIKSSEILSRHFTKLQTILIIMQIVFLQLHWEFKK